MEQHATLVQRAQETARSLLQPAGSAADTTGQGFYINRFEPREKQCVHDEEKEKEAI